MVEYRGRGDLGTTPDARRRRVPVSISTSTATRTNEMRRTGTEKKGILLWSAL